MPNEVQPSVSQSLLLQALEQISAIDGKIGVLQGQNNLILADQKSAADGRKAIYDKLNRVDVLASTVDRIAPLVDKHEATHQQAAGAMSLGKWLWTISAGAIGAGLTMIVQRVTGGGVPHP